MVRVSVGKFPSSTRIEKEPRDPLATAGVNYDIFLSKLSSTFLKGVEVVNDLPNQHAMKFCNNTDDTTSMESWNISSR